MTGQHLLLQEHQECITLTDLLATEHVVKFQGLPKLLKNHDAMDSSYLQDHLGLCFGVL